MPRFHFNVNDELDVEGYGFCDLRGARRAALAMAGQMIADEDAEAFWNSAEWNMQVTTSDGVTVFELSLVGTKAA
jgi:hypothetical protein